MQICRPVVPKKFKKISFHFLVKWVYHKLYIFHFQIFDTNWPSLIYSTVQQPSCGRFIKIPSVLVTGESLVNTRFLKYLYRPLKGQCHKNQCRCILYNIKSIYCTLKWSLGKINLDIVFQVKIQITQIKQILLL